MSGWPHFFLPLSAVPQGCQFSAFLPLVPCHYTFVVFHQEVYFFDFYFCGCENIVPNLFTNLFQLRYMFYIGVSYLINLCCENPKLYIPH